MTTTAIFRCPDGINNFKFSVKLKEIRLQSDENVISNDFDEDNGDTYYVANFKWQEKKFGISDVKLYTDKENCSTDLERRYSDLINSNDDDSKGNFIYTYIDADHFRLPEYKPVTSRNVSPLNNSQLFPGEEHETMTVAADFGDRYETDWIKRERILLTLCYYKARGILFSRPDFNRINYIDNAPNDNGSESPKKYAYIIKNESLRGRLTKDEQILNKVKLHHLKLKTHHIADGRTFVVPPKDTLNVYVFVEILAARSFHIDSNALYVRYAIDLPAVWTNADGRPLQGCTHCCRKRYEETGETFYYGFPFEYRLQCDVEDFQANRLPLHRIYFEAVSRSKWWDRWRAEGTCHVAVPVHRPGVRTDELNCTRIASSGLYANLKRHFIGDYMSSNDIAWYGLPEGNDRVINKYGTETISNGGQLIVRTNVVHQSQAYVDSTGRNDAFRVEKPNASGLIKSVERVLAAFRDARRRMLEARERN